ncbi:hypothetical protein FB567DRAFT_477618, partial [Paraphoma chrysanthemicola]
MDYYKQNELPENVRRYKIYTDSFQDWLLKTAANRNVEYAKQVAEQAKRRKGKKTHKMSVEQQERLIDAIAETKQPLTDISGIRDLDDAIRLRKEVFQYHKVNDTADTGHAFFNFALEGAKQKFAALIAFIPVALKSHDITDDISIHLVDHFRDANSDEDEELKAIIKSHGSDVPGKVEKTARLALEALPDRKPFTREEKILQQRLLILCFLYLLNRIRAVIREVWVLFRHSKITAVTAALVTDLAMSHIQQSVSALVEELDDIGERPNPLPIMVKELCIALSQQSPSKQLDDQALHHLFCVEAINHINAYVSKRATGRASKLSRPDDRHPYMPFLQFYDIILRDKIKLPLWDKFTEDILRDPKGSSDWLSFGFQIMLDVQEIVRGDRLMLYRDVMEHALDIATLMRVHIEYEDRMWAMGKKPDYMSQGCTKFSNVFIGPLNSLLEWLQVLVKAKEGGSTPNSLTIDVFASVQATMSGLAMSYFGTLYQSISISKVKWFLTSLCHLYNAARQVGGLGLAWADLDFIVHMHGPKRIFVGDTPTDPNDFQNRALLAMCVSSRYLASDHNRSGTTAPITQKYLHHKHGPVPEFPLEEKIRAYYKSDQQNSRWMKRHNVFNHLHQLVQIAQESDEPGSTDDAEFQELQTTFSKLVTKIAPPKRKKKVKSRVSIPQISDLDDTHTPLLRRMGSELQSHELHSNFDYLSLYRRGFGLALKLRKEVLFDETMQIARRGDISKNQNPDCYNLILDLFERLKIKPKAKDVKVKGDELSTDVVALDQLKRVAKIMEGVIQSEGSVELDRAKLRVQRDWAGLKKSYAAEDALQGENDDGYGLDEIDGDSSVDSEDEPDPEHFVDADKLSHLRRTVEALPPGSWPEDDGIDPAIESQLIHETSVPSDAEPDSSSLPDLCTAAVAKDNDSTERHRTGTSSLIDDFLDDFASPLGSETEAGTKKHHQAYVLDELDEILHAHDATLISTTSCERVGSEEATDYQAGSEISPKEVETSESNHHNTADASITNEPGGNYKKAIDLIEAEHEFPRNIPEPSITAFIPDHLHKPALISNPSGIFHRLKFSSTVSRRHLVSLKRTSPATVSLVLTRRRWGFPHRLAGTPKKHFVSMRCYALCILARNLLGKESRSQRRVRDAARIVKERKKGRSYDLHAAWNLA